MQNISDVNLVVSENIALADETITLPVLTLLQVGLDPHVEQVSLCNILYILCGMLLEVFFTQNFLSCSCLQAILQFPKIYAVADLSCYSCK